MSQTQPLSGGALLRCRVRVDCRAVYPVFRLASAGVARRCRAVDRGLMLLWGSVFTLGASVDVLPSSALSPTLLLRIHPQHRDPDKMVSTDPS